MVERMERTPCRAGIGTDRRDSSGLAALALLAVLAGCSEVEDPASCDGVGCSSRGFCLLEGGRPYCACLRGYHPIGLACLENDPDDPCAGITCADHGTCRIDGTDVTCDCQPGYTHIGTDDPRCAADRECDLLCVPVTTADGPRDDAAADTTATEDVVDTDETEPPTDVGACPNGFLDPGEECDGNSEACGDCGAGTRTCTGSCTWGACDWDATCHPGDSQSCGTDCTTNCTDSCWFGACLCDISSRACTTGGCPGTQTCTNGGSSCSWSSCSAPASCSDYWGATYCSGSRSPSATASGCPASQCKGCDCEDGSWTRCDDVCRECPA